MQFKRIFLIILDSLGVGETKDAYKYNSIGANTLGHINDMKKLFIPNLKKIGFLNTTQQYQDYKFLWFPLGVYVIISNSISHSGNGLVASLQLKDKMCLLNGDCGGVIPASTVFDSQLTILEESNQEKLSFQILIQE